VKRSSAVLALALVTTLATGCTGGSGEKPTVLPTVTAVPVTPLSSEVPPVAKPATPAGAAAFVEFWFRTLDQAYQSGAAFPVEQLSDARCGSCRNFSEIADGLVRERFHFLGPSFVNLDAQAPPLQRGLSFVTFTCELPAREKVDDAGKSVARYPAAKRLLMTVTVERHGNGWVVRAMKSQ
jgi:hypothetical protein